MRTSWVRPRDPRLWRRSRLAGAPGEGMVLGPDRAGEVRPSRVVSRPQETQAGLLGRTVGLLKFGQWDVGQQFHS